MALTVHGSDLLCTCERSFVNPLITCNKSLELGTSRGRMQAQALPVAEAMTMVEVLAVAEALAWRCKRFY